MFLYRSSLGHTALESCRLAELKWAIFGRTGRKTKKITALEALPIDDLQAWAPRGIDNLTSIQRYNPYTIGKLSIRRVKICNFSWIRHKTED